MDDLRQWREDMSESRRRVEALRERTQVRYFTRVVRADDEDRVEWERQRIRHDISEFLAEIALREGRWYAVRIADESELVCKTEEPWRCTGYVKLHYVLTIVQEE
jgi:hypothetical protein